MNNTPTFIKLPGSKKLYPGFFFLMIMIFSANIMSAQEIYYVPVELSGFNEDVIAEALPANSNTTTSVDNAENSNFAFIAKGLDSSNPDIGLTEDLYTSNANENIIFKLNNFNVENSLRITRQNSSPGTGSLEFVNPIKAQKLHLFLTSGSGLSKVNIQVNFTDNSQQNINNVIVPDWYNTGTLPIALFNFGRIKRSNNNFDYSNNGSNLFQQEILINSEYQDKEISSISFALLSGSDISFLNILAITAEVEQPPVETVLICPYQSFNLNNLFENPEDYTWYENDEITEVSNPFEVGEGIYYGFDGSNYWPVYVSVDFSGDCEICFKEEWENDGNIEWVYPCGSVQNDPNCPSYDVEVKYVEVNGTTNLPGSEYMILDVYKLDNSFDLIVNDVNITAQEIEFQTGDGLLHNIHFKSDQAYWQDGNIPAIWSFSGQPDKPMVRVVINSAGVVTLYGSRVSATATNYFLEELELTNGNYFEEITWHNNNSNTITIEQTIHKSGGTSFNAKVYGSSLKPCHVFINPQIRHRVQH